MTALLNKPLCIGNVQFIYIKMFATNSSFVVDNSTEFAGQT